MKSPTTFIIVFIIIAAIITVETHDGEVYNPLPGDAISNSDNHSEQNNSDPSPNEDAPVPEPPALPESAYTRYISIGERKKSEFNSAPGNESVTISLSRRAPGPVTITGWQIWSVGTGARATIPQGTMYPEERGGGPLSSIILKPGEEAIIYTGTSPLGISFIPNMCLSHLADTKQLPRTIGKRCPDIEDIALPLPFFDRNNECERFIERLPSCAVPQKDSDFPSSISRQCENYVRNVVGYENCVRLRQNDKDFFEENWLVYLGSPAKMYKDSGEKILLFDEKGLLIDSY